MITLILGMHKSGTTLVAKILQESGINMVEDKENHGEYDSGNKMERETTKAINHSILASEGKFSLDVKITNRDTQTQDFIERMNTLVNTYNDQYPHWGFKDPRTCLTYNFWKNTLQEHRIIIIYRPIAEVWKHYWADARYWQKVKVFFKFIKRWCEYNNAILEILDTNPAPSIVIDYSHLMSSKLEFDRLQDFLKIPLHDSRIPIMYRSKPDSSLIFRLALFIHKLGNGPDPEKIYADLCRHAKN